MDRYQITKKVFFIAVLVFLMSLLRYIPYIYKNGSPWQEYSNLTLARNYAQTGKFSLEDSKNRFLTTALLPENGQIANLGNTFTPVIYAGIFKIFGFNFDLPVKITVILFALSSALIFLLIFRLFGLWPAIFAGALDLFLSLTWLGSLTPGFYEWSVVFFIIGCLFYFYYQKAGNFTLVIVGVFIALAFISRNAFIVSLPALLLYDFFKFKSPWRIALMILPIILCFMLWEMPGWLSPAQFNTYLSDQDTSFGRYGHFFNDPYVYLYDRENFVKENANTDNPGTNDFLIKYNYPVSFKARLIVYLESIRFYAEETFNLVNFGGAFIVLFVIIGLCYLFLLDRSLAYYFIYWLIIWFCLLVYLRTNNWDHFLEIRWPLLTLASLGITATVNQLKTLNLIYLKKYLSVLVVLILIINGVFDAKWMFHEEYTTGNLSRINDLVTLVKQNNPDKNQVMAVSDSTVILNGLHYLTDQTLIFFHPATVSKLIEENKLAEAFSKFDVKYAIGFSPEVSDYIEGNNIARVLK